MATFQGKEVTVVRAARQGDEGFKNDGSQQVVIRQADGTEKTVAKTDVKD